jgi:long-chain acyl-CoA synthetase
VPIKRSGTERVLPPDTTGLPKKGKVTVTFGKPLRFRFEDPAEIVKITQEAVEKL